VRIAFAVLVAAVFAFLLSPLLVVLAVSFTATTVPDFPPQGLSLRWYAQALRLDLFRNGLVVSVLLGVAAAAVSSLLGVAAALAVARARFRGRAAIEAALLSPLVVPGIVIGIALLAFFAQVGLRSAPWRLMLAHALITLPYCARTTMVSLARLDPTYEQAAETLGASRRQVLRHVTLPLIRPGIVAGALFAFVISFDNVPVSIFLVDAETTTLPLAIISYLEYNFDPSVAAISSVLIVAMLGLAFLLERIAGLRRVLGSG
jgi:putative spermidine/putrescine transport system permease protein